MAEFCGTAQELANFYGKIRSTLFFGGSTPRAGIGEDGMIDGKPVKMCPFVAKVTAYGHDESDSQYGAEMASLFPCVEDACMAWRDDDCALIARDAARKAKSGRKG